MAAVLCCAAAHATRTTVVVDPTSPSGATPLHHIWENTGWCPPDMDASPAFTAAYATQEASWQNHAWIAAVPNRGIKNVRIHSLLNMITVIQNNANASTTTTSSNTNTTTTGNTAAFDPADVHHPLPSSAYNFTLLDGALDLLVRDHGLSVGFELMGNPRVSADSSTGIYTSWKDADQLQGWRVMVATLVKRYIGRYGLDAVATWRFEPWNEPDHGCRLVETRPP